MNSTSGESRRGVWLNVFNPFSAMLTAPSLGTRTTNKNAKFEIIKAFSPSAWPHERISVKMHSIESRFVTGPSNILFAGVYVCTFLPGNFTCWGSEGVNAERSPKRWADWRGPRLP